MKAGREVRVVFVGNAKKEFEKLNEIVGEQKRRGRTNSDEIQLLNSILQKKELLKENPELGDNLPKCLIPKAWDVNNLWRIELTHFWRMLRTFGGCFIHSAETRCRWCVSFWRLLTTQLMTNCLATKSDSDAPFCSL